MEGTVPDSVLSPLHGQALEKDLEEVTVAVELGGSGLKSKWGTPDVVGVYRPRAADIVKFQHEIVSSRTRSG
jgi:hypothetical protein